MRLMTRHGRLLTSIVLCCGGGLVVAGCAQWATYPPVEVKAARAFTRAETAEPLPTIMALSIDYVRTEYLPGKDLPVNLPAGTDWNAYTVIFSKVKDGAGGTTMHPMTQSGEAAICITEVRTRGSEAEVDVIYPRSDGLHQFATLSLEREVFKDWHVKSARLWQIRDVTLPEPTYVPPTPEELSKKKLDHGPNGEKPAATQPAASQPAK